MLAVTEQGHGDITGWEWIKHHVFKVPLLGPSIRLGSQNQRCRYHVACMGPSCLEIGTE